MNGRKTVIGLALVCALVLSALGAQAASAASNQTIFECTKSATTKTFSDAHCDNESGTLEYGHKVFPSAATAISLTNGKTKNATTESTTAVMKVPLVKGFKNVEITCTTVSGTGTALNSASGAEMKGSGSGTINFTNAGGANCSTNQAGCTAKVNPVGASAETVDIAAAEMGLKFFPTTGGVFATVKFEGTCGMAALGALNVEGSVIATAGGVPNGKGATAVITAAMSSLIFGGGAATLEGTATLSRTSTGNALVVTTSPYKED